MSATGVMASTARSHRAGAGSNPSVALHDLIVRPIPKRIAGDLVARHHYLHSAPAGTHLAFGVFIDNRLAGAVCLGVGPKNAHRLVDGATADDVLTLSRLWLSEDLPCNGESRVLGIVARLLRKHTHLLFLLSYADPSAGHVGTIYQASGWLYTGQTEPMPLYDLGDGVARHSRTLSFNYGSHSLKYLRSKGVEISTVPQLPKHRYILPLRPGVAGRLTVQTLPYPKREVSA